jgi:hypothetical protein
MIEGIMIGCLVGTRLPGNKNVGIVLDLKKSDQEHFYLDNVLAEVYWSHLSRTRMEFIGDLEVLD